MSYITVEGLTKTFLVRKKREKGKLLREKAEIKALTGVFHKTVLARNSEKASVCRIGQY